MYILVLVVTFMNGFSSERVVSSRVMDQNSCVRAMVEVIEDPEISQLIEIIRHSPNALLVGVKCRRIR